MLKSTLALFLLPTVLLLASSSNNSAAKPKQNNPAAQTETVEKLIVANGTASLELDLSRLNNVGTTSEAPNMATLHFALAPDSFFTIVVTNDVLRDSLPGSVGLNPQNSADLPQILFAALHQLILEKVRADEGFELVVRDAKTNFAFFNVEGADYDYNPGAKSFRINNGRLLVSEEFAKQLRLPSARHAVVGNISLVANMQPIEIKTIVDGEVQSADLPALH